MRDKKGITITDVFKKKLKEYNRKPKKIWVNKDSEFYNRSMKPFLQNDDTEMYSTDNEEKSVVAERIFRMLKNKINKHMSSISKNVYIDKLNATIHAIKQLR